MPHTMLSDLCKLFSFNAYSTLVEDHPMRKHQKVCEKMELKEKFWRKYFDIHT